MKFNIRQKLVGLTCLLVFLVGMAIGGFSVFKGRQQVRAAFEEQSRGMAQIVADGLTQDIFLGNLSGLHHRVEALLAHSSVTSIQIFDGSGNLQRSADKSSNKVSANKLMTLSREALSGNWKSHYDGDVLRISGPVILSGSVVGYLSVGFSLAKHEETLAAIFNDGISVVVLLLLFASVAAYLAARHFTAPILNMRDTARAIEAGSLSARAAVGRHDELGELGASLNSMAAFLESSQRTAQSAEEELRRGLDETRALQEVGQLILESKDSREVLEQVLQKTTTVCGFDFSTILAPNPDGNTPRAITAHGYRDPTNIERRSKQKINYGMTIIDAPLVLDSIQNTPGMRTLKKEGAVCALFVPIQSGGEILGFLQLANRSARVIGRDDIRLAEGFGRQIGIAIQKTKLADVGRCHLA